MRSFEAAARHLSFTRAGQELCLTQSAVSRQIQLLETQCGMPLFLRVNRGLRLTEAGQRLLTTVSQAHGLVDEALAQLADQADAETLRIGVAAPFAALVLAPALHRFTARHPRCSFHIVASDEPSELEQQHPHVLIRHYRPGAAPVNAVRLATDAVLPVCAPSLLSGPAAAPLLYPGDLKNHCLLRYETLVDGRSKIDWFRWLAANGLGPLRPRATLGFNHYEHVVQAALNGAGVAIGRLPLVARHLADGRLLAPFPGTALETGAWHASIARDHKTEESGLSHDFVAWLGSELGHRTELPSPPPPTGALAP
ncbi:LysR substrate-binding domain-containing protein [Paucibacter sp. XJ19-41]|uniref:LysR substrate-binding domain-containing protein n=1 Tax=Paucibacter sp. XJ19-41 TaxID=2927824 RepID=UPI002349D3D2|nr:LysR substrate-binding domain-containing protein [Paucibacter sp. XJ19-41]MDC6168715.1 LysR substrate-binding domain-containing protein [Paucibacter sp. XJ19-41]